MPDITLGSIFIAANKQNEEEGGKGRAQNRTLMPKAGKGR